MTLRYLLFVFLFFSIHLHAKTQAQAIQTIVAYTQLNAVTPTVSDYNDAGVTDVGTHNIDGINEKISKHQANEVDTTVEIQIVVDEYVLMIHAVLNIITNHILNSETLLPSPTWSVIPASVVSESTISLSIHGEVGYDVYINNVLIGQIGANGVLEYTYTLSEGDNHLVVILKNSTGEESYPLNKDIFYKVPDLVINEISSAYYTGSDRWFEIYNPKATAINLSNYTLKSRYYDGNNYGDFEFSFPSKVIPAGGYMVVRSDYGPAYNTTLPAVESSEVMYLKDGAYKKYPLWYSDIGGYLELLKDGKTVDFVSIKNTYTPTTIGAWNGSSVPAFTSNPDERYKSIVRDINSSDSNRASDWVVRDFSTYAAINDVTCNDDVDADGIPDCSERSGTKYAGMDLYAIGARENQKDIFIEVDYIDSTDGGNRVEDKGVVPQIEALQKVEDAFLNKGYHVHFDVGDLFAQDGATLNPAQMDLGGGNLLPYIQSLTLNNVINYKPTNMQTQRKAIFHYMVFGTSQNSDGSAGSSGLAEILGNDLLITLGSWGLSDDTVSHKNSLINFQAATVMHEFGHNLGLLHGGDEGVNYKPNYLSIMNYLYQLNGLATIGDKEGDRYYHEIGGNCPNTAMVNPYYGEYGNFKIDYSDGTSTNIDEVNSVVEANGLGRTNSVPVDYNCNDVENNTLTNFNVNPGWDTSKTVLKDYNDWANINIVFAHTYSGNSGASLNKTANKVSISPLSNDRQPIAKEPAIKIPSLR